MDEKTPTERGRRRQESTLSSSLRDSGAKRGSESGDSGRLGMMKEGRTDGRTDGPTSAVAGGTRTRTAAVL